MSGKLTAHEIREARNKVDKDPKYKDLSAKERRDIAFKVAWDIKKGSSKKEPDPDPPGKDKKPAQEKKKGILDDLF